MLPEGCLVNATSYKYAQLAKNKLPNSYAKILIVRYTHTDTRHAYTVFSTNGKDRYLYDEYCGSVSCMGLTDPFEIAVFITRRYNLMYSDRLAVFDAHFLED